MMNIKTLEIAGFKPAFKGMRNAFNSWDKSDSPELMKLEPHEHYMPTIYESRYCNAFNNFIIGKNDMELAQSLVLGGMEHCKFLRQIHVWADINMPRYWWSEFDTYHYNTKNSCSTMHKLFDKKNDYTLDMFEFDIDDKKDIEDAIYRLNQLKIQYFSEKNQINKDKILKRAKSILPEGYLQLRTVDTNYAELRNIYKQRVLNPHRLKKEWVDTFGEWLKTLPYYNELIALKKEEDNAGK